MHPQKAFVLRHIPLLERYDNDHWEGFRGTYASADAGGLDSMPDVAEYVARLHASVETLFGPMEFDLHHAREYPKGELPFHSDIDDPVDRDVLRMVTCIHNAADETRSLHFARPTWTNHVESFALVIPPGTILAFGGSLTTDYEHGIPADPSVVTYRSVVTRFCRYAQE